MRDRRDVAVAVRVHGAPEAAEVGRARIVDGEVAPQQLARHLDVEPEHEGFDEALLGSSSATLSAGTLLQTGQQPVLRQRRERLGHRLREHGRAAERPDIRAARPCRRL